MRIIHEILAGMRINDLPDDILRKIIDETRLPNKFIAQVCKKWGAFGQGAQNTRTTYTLHSAPHPTAQNAHPTAQMRIYNPFRTLAESLAVLPLEIAIRLHQQFEIYLCPQLCDRILDEKYMNFFDPELATHITTRDDVELYELYKQIIPLSEYYINPRKSPKLFAHVREEYEKAIYPTNRNPALYMYPELCLRAGLKYRIQNLCAMEMYDEANKLLESKGETWRYVAKHAIMGRVNINFLNWCASHQIELQAVFLIAETNNEFNDPAVIEWLFARGWDPPHGEYYSITNWDALILFMRGAPIDYTKIRDSLQMRLYEHTKVIPPNMASNYISRGVLWEDKFIEVVFEHSGRSFEDIYAECKTKYLMGYRRIKIMQFANAAKVSEARMYEIYCEVFGIPEILVRVLKLEGLIRFADLYPELTKKIFPTL